MELEKRLRAGLEGSTTRLVILRPAAWACEGGTGLWSRILRRRVAWVPAGFDPGVQWLTTGELADAVRQALAMRLEGGDREGEPAVFHVAPAATEPLRASLARRGVRALPLPTTLIRALHGLARRAPGEVDYLRYPWTVTPSPELGGAAPERPAPDDRFGMDRNYIDRLGRTLFRFLHDRYWRVEWSGLEHIPRSGGAVLAGNHRGHQPWDGIMVLHRLASEIGRYPRFLVHPTLLKLPFLAPYMTRCGGVPACRENGDEVLDRGELLAIFPEGIRGAFAEYRDRGEGGVYALRRFGRHDFVKFALRHQRPIVPFVIVGSAEIFPIYAKLHWRWWREWSEWPCLPITPTMSTLPLPSKWHGLFLPPVEVKGRFGPEAAGDPRLVRRLSDEIKGSMAAALEELLARRPGLFAGSIYEQPTWPPPAFRARPPRAGAASESDPGAAAERGPLEMSLAAPRRAERIPPL